ncbi:unnamed protein product [Rotaria sordida]|uniref:MULE transposase domain-containing protein n=2 Tax=Rotaria sordida TaxID=392033 RepID=A0A814KPH1_9BILA|nr:unnamed protein product [Rotaria sordida]
MSEAAVSSVEVTRPKSPTISFINSNKGKPLLVANNYVFKLNKTTTTTKYWIYLNSQLIKTIGDHNHLPEKEKLEVREFREKVKQRAINETTPIPRIYDEECAKAMLSDAAIAVLPSEREMNSGINKARRAITPTIPTTQLFDIPDAYSKILQKNDFLIVDKMITRRQRILLFSSNEQMKMLFTAETILMDGTFSTCPNMFDQVYTIHAIKYDQSFPCVFGLLRNRQKSTYHFMFNELKSIALQMQLNFAPKTIMSDFEPGLLAVVSTEFATATHSSCYFHFTQAIYRAIQRVGLSTSYNDDDDVKQYCRKLMALPLLPEAIIEDTYDELIVTMPKQLKDTLNDLLEYFQQQYRFNRRVQVNHPNIWPFIKILQGEENRFHPMYVQFSAGLGIRPKQAKTIAIQRRIDNLGQRYYDGAISAMEYLDGLSFTVAKQKK